MNNYKKNAVIRRYLRLVSRELPILGKTNSCDVSIFSSDWYVITKSASKSGNSATASVTMGELAAGVTVKQVPISLVLKCDGKGNIS